MYNRDETDKIQQARKRDALVATLARQIEAGRLPVGSRLPSTRALAESFGVSLVTAHRAAQDLEALGLVERRDRQGTYVRDRSAKPTQAYVGLLFTFGDDHVWGDVANAMVSGFQQHGLMTLTSDEVAIRRWRPGAGPDPLQQLVDAQPTAILMRNQLPVERVSPFLKQGSLWLTMDAIVNTGLPIESIAPDLAAGWRAAVNHLVAQGHRRIAVACFRRLPERGRMRFDEIAGNAGYASAMREEGLEPQVCFLKTPEPGAISHELQALLQGPSAPTAIITPNDWNAVEIIRQCERLGIRVPDDLAFVGGFNTPWAEAYDITSIDFRYQEIAQAVVDRVVAFRAAGTTTDVQQHKLFTPHLVLRGSTSSTR